MVLARRHFSESSMDCLFPRRGSSMSLNPEVVVLDEPFAGLDQKGQSMLTAFLGDLKKPVKRC